MLTLNHVLERNKGVGPGFDFLRIFLAFSVVIFHAIQLTGNRARIVDTPFWFAEYAIVPMFFALSGFLVTASGMRLSLKNFLINRGLRILPALAVDITLCALIIGPIFTTFAMASYFTDQKFWLYFLNITGWIHFYLPGVFEDHSSTRVNGALWTVPYEMICYMIISGLIITRSLPSWRKVLSLTLAIIFLGVAYVHIKKIVHVPPSLDDAIRFLLVSRESQIVTAFLFGTVASNYQRYSLSLGAFWFVYSTLLVVCFFWRFMANRKSNQKAHSSARTNLYHRVYWPDENRIPRYFHRGDYSYGVYLYHDPILQSIIAFFPFLSVVSLRSGFILLIIGIPVYWCLQRSLGMLSRNRF